MGSHWRRRHGCGCAVRTLVLRLHGRGCHWRTNAHERGRLGIVSGELDWTSIVISGGLVASSIAAIVGGPLRWLDSKRKEDRDFVASEVADIRAKLVDEIADVEAAALHARNNHKALDQAVSAKFEVHSADLVRLTENQRQTTNVVAEIKAEMRAGFSEMKHDGEKRHDTFIAMLKAESERQRDAITMASAAQAAQIAALAESLRDIRASDRKG
jgi:hypothetical protein